MNFKKLLSIILSCVFPFLDNFLSASALFKKEKLPLERSNFNSSEFPRKKIIKQKGKTFCFHGNGFVSVKDNNLNLNLGTHRTNNNHPRSHQLIELVKEKGQSAVFVLGLNGGNELKKWILKIGLKYYHYTNLEELGYDSISNFKDLSLNQLNLICQEAYIKNAYRAIFIKSVLHISKYNFGKKVYDVKTKNFAAKYILSERNKVTEKGKKLICRVIGEGNKCSYLPVLGFHVSCSSDKISLFGKVKLTGIVLYAHKKLMKWNKEKESLIWKLNGIKCRPGYIVIKESSTIEKVKVYSLNNGVVHGKCYKHIFGSEHKNEVCGAGFCYLPCQCSAPKKKYCTCVKKAVNKNYAKMGIGLWKFNSWTFNSDDFSGMHDGKKGMGSKEIINVMSTIEEWIKGKGSNRASDLILTSASSKKAPQVVSWSKNKNGEVIKEESHNIGAVISNFSLIKNSNMELNWVKKKGVTINNISYTFKE